MRSSGIHTLLALVVVASSAFGQQVYNVGDEGVTAPKVVKAVKPDYTQKARDARIEGVVKLRAVVLADGSVSDIVVTQSLDASLNGLDDQAVIALKKWVFEPGTKDGKPVAVRVLAELAFNLR